MLNQTQLREIKAFVNQYQSRTDMIRLWNLVSNNLRYIDVPHSRKPSSARIGQRIFNEHFTSALLPEHTTVGLPPLFHSDDRAAVVEVLSELESEAWIKLFEATKTTDSSDAENILADWEVEQLIANNGGDYEEEERRSSEGHRA